MRLFLIPGAALSALVLSGCGGAPFQTSTVVNAKAGVALKGRVHGGQQPIVGASVYLYAAGTAGYGGASKSLLKSGAGTSEDGNGNYYVTTDANGDFTIGGDYTCPASTTQVYLYSIGGNSGSGTNSAAGLLAALGTCSNLTSSVFAIVNEVSTVATAYAIAGYATDATHVSSSGSALALTGVTNAFATVQNLETLGTGQSLTITPAQNGTAPGYEINTLADILAACVNTNGSTASGMPCNTLLSNAMNGSTMPTETATAAINIAHNPGANVATLYVLATANPPFQPTLASTTGTPNDWTVGIDYGGCVTSFPEGLAIDGSGNVWLADQDPDGICEFSPLGVPAASSGYTGGGLASPWDVAIDSLGDVWVTNEYGNSDTSGSVSEFSSTGSVLSNAGMYGFTGGQLSLPWGIAIDSNDNVWIADGNPNTTTFGYDITEYNSAGSNYANSPYSNGGLDNPVNIAIDTSNNVWIANGSGSISEFSSAGSPISPDSTGYTGGGLESNSDGTGGIAIDASGNVWSGNLNSGGSPVIGELNSSGTAVNSSGYTSAGLEDPSSMAIDGAGNVWVDNTLGNALVEFNSTGTALGPAGGYIGSGLYTVSPVVAGMAIDGSGNIWISNYYLESLVEVVGAAAPVVTPIVANLKTPYGLHAVNEP
jgi:hypothetical protein